MFRKFLCWLLAVQHFYVYTFHSTLLAVGEDSKTIPSSPVRAHDFIHDLVDVSYAPNLLTVNVRSQSSAGQQKTIWNGRLSTRNGKFDPSGFFNVKGYKANFAEGNSLLTLKKEIDGKGYLFHISANGDVRLGRLDHHNKVKLGTTGKFSTGEQGLYKSTQFSVTAREAYLEGKISVDTLKLKIRQSQGHVNSNSPVIIARSGVMMIGDTFHIKQQEADQSSSGYIKDLCDNQGTIINKTETTSYTIDFHGNDLKQLDIGRLPGGKSLNSMTSENGLIIRNVRNLYNAARIESRETLTLHVQERLHNDKGAKIGAAHVKVDAKTLENDSNISGHKSLEMHLGRSNSRNSGSIFTGENGLITVQGTFLNIGTVYSHGNLRIQGALPSARLQNQGRVKAFGLLDIRDFKEFQQEGSVRQKSADGHLNVFVENFLQTGKYAHNRHIPGLLSSKGTLHLQGQNYRNNGTIRAHSTAEVHVSDFQNFEEGLISFLANAKMSGDIFINKGHVNGFARILSSIKTVENHKIYEAVEIVFQDANLLQNFGRFLAAKLMSLCVQIVNNFEFMRSKGSFDWDGLTFENTNKLASQNAKIRGGTFQNNGTWGVVNQLRATLNKFINAGEAHVGSLIAEKIGYLRNEGKLDIDGLCRGIIEILLNNNHIQIDGHANLQGNSFTNNKLFKVDRDADLNFSESFANMGEMHVQGNLNLRTQRFDQSKDAKLTAGQNINLRLQELQNKGLVGGNRDVVISIHPKSGQVSHNSGTLFSGRALHITSDGQLVNQAEGKIESQDSIKIQGQGSFINEGSVEGNTFTEITVKTLLNNHFIGTLLGALNINVVDFTNNGSITSVGGTLSLILTRGIQKGVLFSKGNMHIEVADLLRILRGENGKKYDIETYSGNIHFLGAGRVQNEGAVLANQDQVINLSFDNHGALEGNRIRISGTPENPITFDNQKQGRVKSLTTLEAQQLEAFRNSGTVVSEKSFEIQARNFANSGNLTSVQSSGLVNSHHYTNTDKIETQEDLTIQASESFDERGSLNSSKKVLIQGQGTQGAISGTVIGKESVEITSLGSRVWNLLIAQTAEVSSEKILWIHGLNVLTIAGKALANILQLHSIATLTTQAGSLLRGETSAELKGIANVNQHGDLETKSLSFSEVGSVLIGNSGSIKAQNSAAFKRINVLNVLGKLILAGTTSIEEVKELIIANGAIFHGNNLGSINKVGLLTVAGQVLCETFSGSAITRFLILATGAFQSNRTFSLKTVESFENAGKVHSESDLEISDVKRALQNTGRLSSKGHMRIQGTGSFTNDNEILSSGDLNVTEWNGKLQNQKAGKIESESHLSVGKSTHVQNFGLIRGGKTTSITTKILENEVGGLIAAKGANGASDLKLNVMSGYNKGQMESSGETILRIQNTFKNENKIVSDGKLTVIGLSDQALLSNESANAHLHSKQDIEFKTEGRNTRLKVRNNASDAKIDSNNDVVFAVGSMLENLGKVLAKRQIVVFQETFDNKGVLSATHLAFPNLVTLVNTASGQLLSLTNIAWAKLKSLRSLGIIQSSSNISFANLTLLDLAGKVISTDGSILIHYLKTWTNFAEIAGRTGVSLTVSDLTNKGRLLSGGTVGVVGTRILNNGEINGHRVSLESKAGTIHNNKIIKATTDASLSGNSIVFDPNHDLEAKDIILTSPNTAISLNGKVRPLSSLRVVSNKSFTHLGGNVGYFLDIRAPLILKSALLFSRGLHLTQSGDFTNTHGLWGEGPLTLSIAGTFTNNANSYSSTDALRVNTRSLHNNALLGGYAPSEVVASGAIINTKTIGGRNNLTLRGNSVENKKDAVITSDADLAITVNTDLVNTVGTISAGRAMSLKGKRLFNKRDGYYIKKSVWTSYVHEEKETPYSNKASSIKAQSDISIDFSLIESEASEIISAAGDIYLKFKTLKNSTKFLLRRMERKIYMIVGKKKVKAHKFKFHHEDIWDWRWTNIPQPNGSLLSRISAGRDVIFEVNGQRLVLPTSVPEAWENHRQQILRNVKASPTKELTSGFKKNRRFTISTAGAELAHNKTQFQNPSSFLSNANETGLISINYWDNTRQKVLRTENFTINNPRKVLLESLFPGLINTGTIVGRTVGGNVGYFQHGFQNSGAATPQERLGNVFIQLINHLVGVGAGHLLERSQKGPFAIQEVIPHNSALLEELANSVFISGLNYLSRMAAQGRPVPNGVQMGDTTLVLDTPFHGGPVGNFLYTGEIPYLTARTLTSVTSGIAVLDDPRLTGHERMMMSPHLEAAAFQRAFLNELRTPSIFANVPNSLQQQWVLRENGLRQARKLKGLPPLPEEALQAMVPHREIISPEILSQFKDPAIIYQLTQFANEWVLTASFFMGEEIARKFFRAHEGQIVGNIIAMNSHMFDISGDMTGGEVQLNADTHGRIQGARLEAQQGSLGVGAQQLEITTQKTVSHSSSGGSYTHTERHKPTQLIAKDKVVVQVAEKIKLVSTTIESGQGIIVSAKEVEQLDESDIDITHTESKKRRGLSKTTVITHDALYEKVRTIFKTQQGGVVLYAENGGVLQAPIVKSEKALTLIKRNPNARFVIMTSQDVKESSVQKSRKAVATQSQKNQGNYHTRIFMLESAAGVQGTLDNTTIQIPQKGSSLAQTLESLEKDPKTAWVKDLRNNPNINWDQVSEIHNTWHQKSFSLTPGASLVVSLAIAIAVAGPASSLATSLVGAPGATMLGTAAHATATTALKTIAAQAGLALLNTKGDIQKTGRQLLSTKNVKKLATTVAVSGLIGTPPGLPVDADLAGHVKTAVIQTVAQDLGTVLIEGQSLKRTLKDAPRQIAVQALSGYAAQKIGDFRQDALVSASQDERIGVEILHKAAHGLVGAASGAVLSQDKKQGALSGALGSALGETVAELLPASSVPGEGLDPTLLRPALPQNAEIAKLVATTVAAVSNLDSEITLQTADTTIRNNFLNPSHDPEIERRRAEISIQNGEKMGEAFKEAWEEANTEIESLSEFKDRIAEATQDPLLDRAPALKSELQSKSKKYVEMIPTTRLDVATNLPGPGTAAKGVGLAIGLGSKAAKVSKTADVVSKTTRVQKTAPVPSAHPQAFPQQAKRYIEDMTSRSKMEIPKNQRDLLGEAVRGKKFVKLERQEYLQHAQPYKNPKLKEKLISEWETNTGQQWPRYEEPVYSTTTGKLLKDKGDLYDAHHIIPQQNGGPHEWWNMHPLKMGKDHQSGIHGTNSVLNHIVKETK